MKKNIILCLIVLLGFALRIYGVNWDQGQHLHPDERFLTMVAMAEKIPASLDDYFSPQKSSLNPHNVGYPFFVYGILPVTLTKILAVWLRLDNYNDFTLLGRFLSAIFDTLTLIVIYKMAALWEKKYRWDPKIKFLAGFFYAFSVFPIQLAHFFAAETFLTFFMLAAFYFALNFSWRRLILSGIFFGLALGTKITAVYIFPLILFFLIFALLQKKQRRSAVRAVGLFIIFSYLTLRLADPKFFASANILNPKLSPTFMQNLKELSRFSDKDVWYPPAVQWISKKPIVFPLTNIVFFGLGAPYFLLAAVGMYLFVKKRNVEFMVVAVWMISFFLYQSTRFAATMRYFIFLYPFFAICAGFGLVNGYRLLSSAGNRHACSLRNKWIIITITVILIWPLSFMSIYGRKHSRVQASAWIAGNIPQTSFLAEEHWDDFLPVGGGYEGVQMPVFAPDTEEKWREINTVLDRADYLILTSNRGYDSMMKAPQRYPRMARFYRDLFDGRLAFSKIKEFTSYPGLNLGFLKLELKDDWAEESFTVYDHPKVMIFKKLTPWIPE